MTDDPAHLLEKAREIDPGHHHLEALGLTADMTAKTLVHGPWEPQIHRERQKTTWIWI